MAKLWEKGISLDRAVEEFTSGDDAQLDVQLAEFDILGSIAHAKMLTSVGLLQAGENAELFAALKDLLAQARSGDFAIEAGVEDVHSQVEILLTERLGEIGKKIHTARSRNDQVLLDVKMYLRSAIQRIAEQTFALGTDLLELSEQHKDKLLPGYTHMQVAMPSSFGLWFAAYAESLAEDLFDLQAAYRRANRNPLGSAAGYGSSLPIDRMLTSRLLGFEGVNINVVHAQMTRGRVERGMATAMAAVAASISRMSADLCFYACDDVKFISLPKSISTGSSIMPHKNNPDVFELLRARCNKLQSLPNELALICSNLPSGYHRDLQLLKECLLPAINNLEQCLSMLRATIAQIVPRADIMQDEVYDPAFTVERVNSLVGKGVAFRDAYRQVASEVGDGSFAANRELKHTHLGSLGNLGNEQIGTLLKAELARFDFESVESALSALLAQSA